MSYEKRKRPDRWGPAPGAYQTDFSTHHSTAPAPVAEAIAGGPGNYRRPCPECDRGPRDSALSIRVEPDGTAIWFCHRCNWTGSTSRHRTSDVVRTRPVKPRDAGTEQAKARKALRKLWMQSAPLDLALHLIARNYLRSRGLGALMDDPPSDIRFAPALDYWTRDDDNKPQKLGAWPALVAIIRGPSGRPVTLHRTYLSADGLRKASVPAPRKLCSAGRKNALQGAAVRLYPATDRLALAEGLETALAVRLASGWPAWSSVSAGGLKRVVVPRSALQVLVAADFDPAGVDAAEALARRLTTEGRRVRVAIPDRPGTDWADELASTTV